MTLLFIINMTSITLLCNLYAYGYYRLMATSKMNMLDKIIVVFVFIFATLGGLYLGFAEVVIGQNIIELMKYVV